jgi:hypothetical protein
MLVTVWPGASLVHVHGVERATMIDRFRPLPASALAGACLIALALTGCSDGGGDFDVLSQIGGTEATSPPQMEIAPAVLPDRAVQEGSAQQEE